MTAPPVPTLLQILDEEELIRFRHRLQKLIKKARKHETPDEIPAAEIWLNIFDAEIKVREAEHKKCKN
jgi:hypothetical protein